MFGQKGTCADKQTDIHTDTRCHNIYIVIRQTDIDQTDPFVQLRSLPNVMS